MSTAALATSTAFYAGPARRGIAWGAVGAVLLAALLHVALFGLLSLAWRAPPPPPEIVSKPVEVSLVDAVALDARAPSSVEPPAQSRAPDPGPPEDAPPPAPAKQAAPAPTPPKPEAEAAPPPKPAPRALPKPKQPVADKPDKPVKTKAASAKPAAPATKAVATTKTSGDNPKAKTAKPTGSLLDDDFRKGLTQTPSRAKVSEAAPGATMDAKAAADIGSAIYRQVQPCAQQQSVSGPGVSRIVVKIHLQLNRDGSLVGRPTIVDHGGVDDENGRYVDAVDRAAVAAFVRCSPLKGLPLDLYDVPRGWKSFTLRFHLPS